MTNAQRYSIRADVLPFHQMGEGKHDALGMPYACRGSPQLSDDVVADIVSVCREADMDVRLHND